MKKFSKEKKEAIVNRYLCSGLSLRAFSENEGVSKSAVYRWSQEFTVKSKQSMSKSSVTAEHRFAIVMDTATFSEEEISQYCRENGLYPDQISQWKQSCINANSEGPKTVNKATKSDKARIRELEKELRRKDKALAEAA
ncbi:MAG: transposase, partial [Flavobacteriales bacterium]